MNSGLFALTLSRVLPSVRAAQVRLPYLGLPKADGAVTGRPPRRGRRRPRRTAKSGPDSRLPSLLTWGNHDDGADQLLVGTYASASQVGRHLTEQLPDFAVLPPGAVDEGLLALLRRELADPRPGHSIVIDRLLDVVVCSALRAAAGTVGKGWLSGTVDQTVAGALDLIHEKPEQPWTVASLAAAVHVSRASLASRFRGAVGDPPGAYLTRWRLTLAADALTSSGDGLDAIARRVGYSSAFALSAAFKRHHGVSPSVFRHRHGAARAVS